MDLLLTNVTIFPNSAEPTLLQGHAVAITRHLIAAVGPEAELRRAFPQHPEVDGGGRLLMPGLINAHNHFYGTFARGLALSVQPQNFGEILKYLWWRLDSSLDLDAVYYSALLPAMLAAKVGVTTIIDHHASPQATDGSLDRIEEALTLVGMRGILCYEVSDRDGPDARRAGLVENARYIRKCQKARAANPAHLFDGLVGLHAAFTLDDETLAAAADLTRQLDRGVHVHVLEDPIDERVCREKYGAGAVERLEQHGLLGPRSIAGHAIHVDAAGADLLAHSDTLIVHNPQSNMNNAVGRADIFGLLGRGLTVGLGTDGMTPDIRAEARAAYLLHRHHLRTPTVGWAEIQKMLLGNNPAMVERLTGQKIGRIAPDYLADIILLDYYPPTPIDGGNFWGHFLFGLVDAPVHTTIINGRVVMHQGVVDHLDEAAIAAAARQSAARVWQRFQA